MKRIIILTAALLGAVPVVRGETAAEKEARVEAQKKAKELARKKAEILKRISHVERVRRDANNRLKQSENRIVRNAEDQKKASERIAKAEESSRTPISPPRSRRR